jgi:hypothetical protein
MREANAATLKSPPAGCSNPVFVRCLIELRDEATRARKTKKAEGYTKV